MLNEKYQLKFRLKPVSIKFTILSRPTSSVLYLWIFEQQETYRIKGLLSIRTKLFRI